MIYTQKSMIYKKLFSTYIIVIIFMLITLDVYIIKKEVSNVKENTLYINEKVVYDINKELNTINNSTNLILQNMYSDQYVINDIIDFLDMDSVKYLENKLQKFSESKNYFYKGIEYFTQNSFSLNEALKDITFVSYSRNVSNSFNRSNQISIKKSDEINFGKDEDFSNIVCDRNTISYIRQIREPVSHKIEGAIILTYNLDYFKNIIKNYDSIHEVMVLDDTGLVVYDSNEKTQYKYYPNFTKLMGSDQEVTLEKNYYINKLVNVSSLITVGKIDRDIIDKLPPSFYNSLIFIDLLLFLTVEGILYMKLRKLNDRMNNILVAMNKVKKGQFDISIPITAEKDELSYISENFNEMCETLNEHIEKSYLAELKQKNAEMIALQNQINPHFLYNTLESIRMKAICNGDRDVGKMLYTLAFLFRTQLKGKNVIQISDELDYCKKYLEIFKFRYEEKFKFNIDCEDRLLEKQIIKFTLQPLIENYLLHGIRLECNNNELDIKIISESNRDEEFIVVTIKDNGCGIPEEKLNELNEMLKTKINRGTSIGLLNAHERLIIAYGEKYGISLKNNKENGTTVIVKIPCKEVESDV